MTIIKRSAIVPYQSSQMYELVNAIEDYPAFLPWCKDAQVHTRDADEVRATLTLTLGSSGIQKSFSTCNRLQHNKMIEVRLLEGPFKHLEGFWRFETVEDNSCKVIFDLEFEFSNKLVSFAIEPMFQHVANTLVDSFSERAKVVYGE